jgi:hypothetical protein
MPCRDISSEPDEIESLSVGSAYFLFLDPLSVNGTHSTRKTRTHHLKCVGLKTYENHEHFRTLLLFLSYLILKAIAIPLRYLGVYIFRKLDLNVKLFKLLVFHRIRCICHWICRTRCFRESDNFTKISPSCKQHNKPI